MLSLTEQELLEHMVKYNTSLIAWETKEDESVFYAKYRVGDSWLLGDVYGIIKKISYCEKSVPKHGVVTFDFNRYKIVLRDLEERKIDEYA